MAGFLGNRSSRQYSGAWAPPSLAAEYSAYQMVFVANHVDLFRWGDRDEDLAFAQDTSLSGQFAQQWKLRAMAQEAALAEATNSNL